MYMSSNAIEVKVTGKVGTVILNRPERCNALTTAMLGDLLEVLDDLYLDKRVRAIVLTGKGHAFCAGMDIREVQEAFDLPDAENRWGENASLYRDVVAKMIEHPKPIIASVNGAAVAGGAGLVLASDMVVACPAADFGLPEPRRGLVAGAIVPLLAFRVGAGQAARLALSSSLIPAAQAERIGIYHETVQSDQLWARAAELAAETAQGSPQAIQLTKRLLGETVAEQLMPQLSVGAAASATAHTTEAAREGLTAFLEKRPPDWD